jgi:radical SAM superfamily enzyme YgiQ (UPF0313 family)
VKILFTARKEYKEIRNQIAILDLAQYVRSLGHEADCFYLDDIQKGRIPDTRYDLVGMSILQAFGNQPIADAIWLKGRFRTEFVMGGKWTQMIDPERIDLLVRNDIKIHSGPGENYFSDREIDFDNYPSWSAVDFKTFNYVKGDVMSSRGCPYNCHFCHNTEKKISYFGITRTVDNIELLFHLGAKRIFILDDVFTVNTGRMDNIYLGLKGRNIEIENRNELFTHVNFTNAQSIATMARYKPYMVHIGIESGDDRMLQLMGKKIGIQSAFDKLQLMHESGLPIDTMFIIGFPGENEESLNNTLNFIKKIQPLVKSIWVSYYQPVYGTRGYEMILERDPGYKLQSLRSKTVSYIDPDVSEEMLVGYRSLMMKNNPIDSKNPAALIKKIAYVYGVLKEPLVDLIGVRRLRIK